MTNQEALEQIKGIWNAIISLGEADTFPGGREAIDLAIAALEQTTWVPVSERLPEDDTRVIATTDKGVVDIAYCYGGSVDVDGEYYLNGGPGEVIAWMPLPEAYLVS